MTIDVLNTDQGMRDVLEAAEEDRAERVRQMLAPAAGMFQFFPGELDLAVMHRQSLGFPIDRELEQSRSALEALERASAWERVRTALTDAVSAQLAVTPTITVPDLTVLLVLGDPTDSYFMDEARGLSGNGSMTGYLMLTLWPTAENLDRLEAAAVHELHHNLRYAPGGVIWDPATVNVGEHVVSEGLADAFARSLYGNDLGYSPIGVGHLNDEAVFAKVVSGLGVTGMENFGAWVLGDAAAERFGAAKVGLPTGAGYAVGNRLVDAYLAATGKDVTEVLHVPSKEIIAVALAHH
ncbi:DUF2268 domain-containing protein [Ruania albidiflava]|uniref:DUF2268 domain-containing protein n=1 Tax=Ruania albidiflava TaxID=366586 RepID=UPI0003B77E4B|nr:DUF2268 domain-containing putative Zn-dependent protease [Ruania albidiflava]